MNWWRRLLGRNQLERELDAELRFHFERHVEDHVRRGLSEQEARRQTQLEFGGLEQVKEACRDARGTRWVDEFVQDVRFSVRLLVKDPRFTFVAVITLALGIGANTAIFTAADAVLRRPLPYRQADRLVHLFETREDGSRHSFSYPEYDEWSRLDEPLDEVAGYNGGSVTLAADGVPERITVAQVTDNFFRLLGVEPQLGRTFRPGESGPGGAQRVVLSDGLWRRQFGADPSVIGDTLELNGRAFLLIGVLREDFQFPLRPGVEIWLPLVPSAEQVNRRDWHWLDLVGRLSAGITPDQAQAALTSARTLDGEAPWHTSSSTLVRPMREEIVRPVRPALVLLIGASVLLLLVVCANVGGLLAMRSSSRRREFAVRIAIGAGRARLVRQILVESLLLTGGSGALGLLVGWWVLDLLRTTMPLDRQLALPHLHDLTLSPPMLMLAIGLTLLTGFSVGLGPARSAACTDPIGSIRGHTLLTISTGRSGRRLLLAAEIAMAVTLLVGTGLLAKSVLRLQEVSPGFDVHNLLTFRIDLASHRYGDDQSRVTFHQRLLARLTQLPGVSGAALINQLPLEGRGNTGNFAVIGRESRDPTEVTANLRIISRHYFDVMGIPLRAGRFFSDRDSTSSRPVALVNRTFARRYLPDRGSVGARLDIPFTEERIWEIVGVVGDERFAELDEPPTPVVYFPVAQDVRTQVSMVVRSNDTSAPPLAAIRGLVTDLDPMLPIYAVRTMEAIVGDLPSIFIRRYVLFLVASFAGLALLLSAIGIYALLARSVVERAHEIGVRVALGATGRDIARLVSGHTAGTAASGVAVGLVLALGVSRYLDRVLFDVRAVDPSTFGIAAAVIATVVVVACWIPTRRAAQLDPSVTLRHD